MNNVFFFYTNLFLHLPTFVDFYRIPIQSRISFRHDRSEYIYQLNRFMTLVSNQNFQFSQYTFSFELITFMNNVFFFTNLFLYLPTFVDFYHIPIQSRIFFQHGRFKYKPHDHVKLWS